MLFSSVFLQFRYKKRYNQYIILEVNKTINKNRFLWFFAENRNLTNGT